MYVIAGVTGKTGSHAAEALLRRGQKVRVIVRDAAKGKPFAAKGAEVAIGDLGDEASIVKALQGAKGFYFLAPPNFAVGDTAKHYIDDRVELVKRAGAAAKKAGVPAVVFLSSVGAHHADGTGPIVICNRAEKALKDVAPSVTFIRAAYFMENWGSVMGAVKAQSVLPFFGSTSQKFPQVGTADIGEAIADALMNPTPGVRAIELCSQEASANDVAAALSKALGKTVQPVAAPIEAAEGGLTEAGLPPGLAALYGEMYKGMSAGLVAFEKPTAVTRGKLSLADGLKPVL